ncbi:signal recognition particle-docking protein FtsY [Lactobacillus sp. PV034]|uniref:signal recognition particle-docking protein FtsY n=1 Tax=Lactobacillus sp. PV034 TaxID=2594495 RepID=UPI003A0FD59E
MTPPLQEETLKSEAPSEAGYEVQVSQATSEDSQANSESSTESLSSAESETTESAGEQTSSEEVTEEESEAPESVKEEATETSVEEDEIDESEEEESEQEDQEKYDKGLEKTNRSFGEKLNAFFAKFRSVDEDFFDDLEDLLIESDVGYETAMQLTDSLRDEAKLQKAKTHEDLKQVVVEKLVEIYDQSGENKDSALTYDPTAKPNVYLFVGVNGAGKTTTIGKLAKRLKDAGKSVMMVAGDTFRAGAVEQLVEWGKRDGVEVITGKENADPASVVYDGVVKAKEEGIDYLLVDTAGRLQNKVNLMNELDKIERTIKKILPDQPNEVLLVLDGSTGQNALLQAKDFNKTTELTGLVLTKLDGSSKGGVVIAIRNEMNLPVKLVGLGEKVDDLADFDAEKFAIGLFQGLI